MTIFTVNLSGALGGGNFHTIQDAINAAGAGDTVRVSAGVYTENVTISTSGITLESVDGRDATVIDGISGAGSLGAVVLASGANDVTIGGTGKGFTINGIDNGNPAVENAAVYIQGAHNNLTIQGNEIVANGDSGMTSEYSAVVTNVTIDGNIFSGQTFNGIPAGEGFGTQFTEVDVPRQLVTLGGNGQNTNGVTFSNNQITGTAGGTNAAGDPQGNTLVTIDAANSTITGNEFSGFTTRYATQLRVREDATDLVGNTYSNDAGGNVGLYLGLSGGESAGTISGNLATYGDGDDVIMAAIGNDSIDGGAGVDTYDMSANGSGASVVDLAGGYSFSAVTGFDNLSNIENVKGSAGNDALLGDAGDNMFMATGGTDNIDGRGGIDTFDASDAVTDLSVDLSTGAVSGAYSATLSNVENVVTGSGDDTVVTSSVRNNVSTGAGEDAITASAGGDRIDGGADFDTVNFAGDRGDYTVTWNGATATIDDGAGNVTWVANVGMLNFATGGNVHLVSETGDYTSIQDAVDNAGNGDEILVSAGTYTEQVTVDNFAGLNITATGEVTIKAPADVVNNGGTSNWSRPINAVVAVGDSTDVVLTGFTVDGDGNGDTIDGAGARFFGVSYHESSGGLENVDITGVRRPYDAGTTSDGFPVVSGAQDAHGLHVDNHGKTQLDFFMHGGSISDFQKNATLIYNANLDINGVTITGGGAQPIIGQNGIQAYNSTGTIQNSTIQDMGYAGPDNVASSMFLLRSNTDLNVINNTMTGAGDDAAKVQAVLVGDYAGDPNSGGAISGNTISGVDTGILVVGTLDPAGIDISDNDISDLDATNMDAAGVAFAPAGAAAVAYTVEGSSVSDNLTGGSADDDLSGLGGDDFIEGAGGADALIGGAGDDTFNYSQAADFAAGETVDGGDDDDTITYDNATGGTLTLGAGVSNVENVEVLDAGNIDASAVLTGLNITGSAADNTLIGTAQDDVIDGGAGNDVLSGGTGDDILDGGDGMDTAMFAGDRDDYTVTWDGTEATVDDGSGNVTTVTNAGSLKFATGGNVHLVSMTGDFSTIQAAYTASVDGDEILVGAGTFAGVTIAKDVTLRGAKADEAGYNDLTLSGGARSSVGESVITSAFNVNDATTTTIDGFRFENTNALNVNAFEANVDFSNNVIVGGVNQFVGGSTGLGTITISNNYVSSVSGNGFQINSMGNGDVTVSGNMFNGTGAGAAAVNANGIAAFEFSGNVVMNTDSHGVQVAGSMGDVTIDDNTFDNTVSSGKVDRGAISVSAPQAFTGDVTITNNTVTNSPYGVAYRGSDDADTTGVTLDVSGNDFSGVSEAGIGYVGNANANALTGGDEASEFRGFGGDDSINGGTGDDTIDGGDGFDTATFTGNFEDYTLDLAAGTSMGADGSDSFSNVEKLVFDDRNVFIVQAGDSVHAAVAAAEDGDLVYLAAGTHTLPSQLSLTNPIEIMGAGEGLTTIVGGANAWAIYVDADDVTVSGFSLDASANDRGIKLQGADEAVDVPTERFTLNDVTITGAAVAEMDIHRVENSTFTNLTVDGDGTAGTGVGITASNNLTFTNLETIDNGWGGVGIFGNTSVPTWSDGSDNIKFLGTLTQNEAISIYAQETDGKPVTNIEIESFAQVYKVFNADHRANGADFTFFFETAAEATAYARGMVNPASAVVAGPEDNQIETMDLGTTFVVGDGMSIQAAVDAASAGDTITILAGTYAEDVVVNKQLTINGANAGIAGDGVRDAESIIDGSIHVQSTGAGSTIDGVSIEKDTATGMAHGVYVQSASNVTVTNSILTGTGDGDTGRGVLWSTGTTGGLEVSNNSISGWRSGMYLNNGSDAIITGNVFDSNGNHINNDGADLAELSNNSFTNSGGAQLAFLVEAGTLSADFSAFMAAGNTFDDGARHISIYASGEGKTIVGSDYNDTFWENAFDNTVVGGAGDDFLRVGNASHFGAADMFDGGDGTDSVVFGSGSGGTLTLGTNFTNVEVVELDTGSNDAVAMNVDASAVANGMTIKGNSAANTLTGTDHDDTLLGGAGDDTLTGGDGDDVMDGGAGADRFFGGAGNNTVTYASSSAGVTANLASAMGSGGDAQGDLYAGISNLIGSDMNDTLIGRGDANLLEGGGGLDVLSGGAGDDTLDGGDGNDIIIGGAGNDRVYDGSGDDDIQLGDGDDYVRAQGGADYYDGGSGTDYISYYDSSGGVRLDFEANTASHGWANNDTVLNFEGASGSKTGDDTITGSSGDNYIQTYGGDDRVYDGSGNDEIKLGDGDDYVRAQGGADSYYGGDGVDYISYYDSTGGVRLDFEANT
ncbi:right-handed parallel beta-helix repeat-containing protein, partial [Roseovarius aestuarii]|nr:right-handed parallel beta-helix repeat-containing protein [Roseovarius aestuarii]